jgi:hypothetical protein
MVKQCCQLDQKLHYFAAQLVAPTCNLQNAKYCYGIFLHFCIDFRLTGLPTGVLYMRDCPLVGNTDSIRECIDTADKSLKQSCIIVS